MMDKRLANKLITVLKEHKKLFIAFDVDDTIIPYLAPKDCPLIAKVRKTIKRAYDAGHTLIMYTCRAEVHQDVKDVILEMEVEVDYINQTPIYMPNMDDSSKVFYNIFLDDKCALEATMLTLDHVLDYQEQKLFMERQRPHYEPITVQGVADCGRSLLQLSKEGIAAGIVPFRYSVTHVAPKLSVDENFHNLVNFLAYMGFSVTRHTNGKKRVYHIHRSAFMAMVKYPKAISFETAVSLYNSGRYTLKEGTSNILVHYDTGIEVPVSILQRAYEHKASNHKIQLQRSRGWFVSNYEKPEIN